MIGVRRIFPPDPRLAISAQRSTEGQLAARRWARRARERRPPAALIPAELSQSGPAAPETMDESSHEGGNRGVAQDNGRGQWKSDCQTSMKEPSASSGGRSAGKPGPESKGNPIEPADAYGQHFFSRSNEPSGQRGRSLPAGRRR